MFDILWSAVSFIIAFGILVTIHEYGHFLAARQFGVQVEVFSIGLGRSIFHWYDSRGTKYVIALIPLGGYVKMLDTRVQPVPESELHRTFNAKTLMQRSWIILAGPLANFILAIALSWVIYLSGVNTFKAVVVGTQPGSLVGGFEINEPFQVSRVQQNPTTSFQDVQLALAKEVGKNELTLEFRGLEQGASHISRSFNIETWKLDEVKQTDLLSSLGFILYQPHILPIIAQVQEHSPAQKAGLQVGDTLLAINNTRYDEWHSFVALLQQSKQETVTISILRSEQRYELLVTPEVVLHQGIQHKRIGIAPKIAPPPEAMRVHIEYGILDGFEKACSHVMELAHLSLSMIKQLFLGHVSLNQLGGPVLIAQSAGQSSSGGFLSFLSFLVFFSVNLGVINLLPLPVLDGGHLLYNLIEAVKGRALSEHVQELGFKIGAAILFSLMAIALFNDMIRLSIF